MNILFFEWPSITNDEIKSVLTELGHKVYCIRFKFNKWSGDRDFLKKFEEKFDELSKDVKIDFVFTINYLDMIAEVCHIKKIKYLSWTYDSPVELGDSNILKYDTNYVFIFDKNEAKYFQSIGYDNIYYFPLAVNVKKYKEIELTQEEKDILGCDISFVGKMYDSDFPQVLEKLDDYKKAYIKALIDAQYEIYGRNILPDVINDNFMKFIENPEFNKMVNKPANVPWADEEKLTEEEEKNRLKTPGANSFMLKMLSLVTNRERLILINLLSKYFNFKLFTYNNKDERLKYAINCGTANYERDAPRVFKASKINLNISVRYISTAIPLRCLDIMGCGGLLMTNFQECLFDHFVENKDLIIYHNMEDALEKARFYLDPKNDTLRKKIAQSGFEKVEKYYNYPEKFAEMFKISGLKG